MEEPGILRRNPASASLSCLLIIGLRGHQWELAGWPVKDGENLMGNGDYGKQKFEPPPMVPPAISNTHAGTVPWTAILVLKSSPAGHLSPCGLELKGSSSLSSSSPRRRKHLRDAGPIGGCMHNSGRRGTGLRHNSLMSLARSIGSESIPREDQMNGPRTATMLVLISCHAAAHAGGTFGRIAYSQASNAISLPQVFQAGRMSRIIRVFEQLRAGCSSRFQ